MSKLRANQRTPDLGQTTFHYFHYSDGNYMK